MPAPSWYAGVGARATPPDVLALMTRTAEALAAMGWGLRSGHATGADQAFEAGATLKRIYLPWVNFEGGRRGPDVLVPTLDLSWKVHEAEELARLVHDDWRRCDRPSRLLHARNAHEVLGDDLRSPPRALLCWTPEGRDVGGTATAIRLARLRGVPVLNMHDPGWRAGMRALLA